MSEHLGDVKLQFSGVKPEKGALEVENELHQVRWLSDTGDMKCTFSEDFEFLTFEYVFWRLFPSVKAFLRC